MNEFYGIFLNQVPKGKHFEVSKVIDNFQYIEAFELDKLMEKAPNIIFQTYEKGQAQELEQRLKKAGADVELVTNTVNSVIPDQHTSFSDTFRYLTQKAIVIRLTEKALTNKIKEQNEKLAQLEQNFEQLKPELAQLGEKVFEDQLSLVHEECKRKFSKVAETQQKLIAEKEARNNRQQEAQKGFWNKIKSSVGNLLDNVETYEQELRDSYIELAKSITNNPDEVTNLQSEAPDIVADILVEQVQDNYQKQAAAQAEISQCQKAKIDVLKEISELIKLGEKKLNLCSSLAEFEEATLSLDREVKGPLSRKAEEVLPEREYPYVKNTIGGAVALVDDYVLITKGGFFKVTNFLDDDANAIKIPVESLTAVQYKESGIKDGFLEFMYMGYFPRPNQNKYSQENVITFRGEKLNEKFKQFKETVEQKMRELKQGKSSQPTQSLSAADEIEKFAKLYEKGFITEAEFTAKKAQILGL
ncbi:MAG: SHOCT domain-containing protein [Spirulinaceae cyanobacterium]